MKDDQEDGLGLEAAGEPPARVGRSATAEDLGPRGKAGKAKTLAVGDEVVYWPIARTSVPARVIKVSPGGRLDLTFRHKGRLEVAEGVPRKANAGGWSMPGELPERDELVAGGRPVLVGDRAIAVMSTGGSRPRARPVEGRIIHVRASDKAVYILRDGVELPQDFVFERPEQSGGPTAVDGLHVATAYGHKIGNWRWPGDQPPPPAPRDNCVGSVNVGRRNPASTMTGEPVGTNFVRIMMVGGGTLQDMRGHLGGHESSDPVAVVSKQEAAEVLRLLNSPYRFIR